MKRFTASLLFLFLLVTVSYSQQTKQPSAQEVMDKMFSVYASCDTYQDKGKVKTSYGYESEFTTAFVRHSAFRFEFWIRGVISYQSQQGWEWRGGTDPNDGSWSKRSGTDSVETWKKAVLWQGKDSFKSTLQSKQTPQNLSEAIVQAKWDSLDSSYTIPTLLLPELINSNMPQQRVKSLTELKMVKEETIDSNPAFKIEGQSSNGNKVNVWIDKERYLILKIRETIKSKRFDITITTKYNPQINVEILSKQLEFSE